MLIQDRPTTSTSQDMAYRPYVRGKFVFNGSQKLYIQGVTYGTFRPDADGQEFHDPQVVERDFAHMQSHGVNAVRTYTVPPRWLLDLAQHYGLWVMVGLPWEQHVTFLDSRASRRAIEDRVCMGVRACAGHPAVLCYGIGNEIPSSIVRWYGPRRIERFLKRLYRAVKAEDPNALVTYVNYPSTEYLDLSFIDLICFNVYLEAPEQLTVYLARLQNIAGERPLLMAEVGLDSLRDGEETQAQVLDWQVRTAFAAGCAGMFIFAWTDEWWRGGLDIEGWDFGLTTRTRQPKPALWSVAGAFAEVPLPLDHPWPHISVVVCTYNGARTIRECLEGLEKLDYPNYEVIVVDDGSTDESAAIAAEYACRVISTPNQGLSTARNIGVEMATGEIVAYLDDDAYPDPHWLTYLAATFAAGDYAGVGGPNIAPPGDGLVADCVAHAPGGPIHVLISDREAEHIPGCNMAFRRQALLEIDGFDSQFRVAGDDVDICWRLQERGYVIGYSPAAVVWHHRRNQVPVYWRQQRGYGRAEALLERKWPEKYNAVGHLNWAGRLYGKGMLQAPLFKRNRIYQGTWGSAPFQSVYQPAPSGLAALLLMPEYYFIIAVLAVLTAIGLLWTPMLLALPVLGSALTALLVQAAYSAALALRGSPGPAHERWKRWRLTTFLHLIQPLARLQGRLSAGLTPWRRRSPHWSLPHPRKTSLWSKHWHTPEAWLRAVETALSSNSIVVLRGGNYDAWDLVVRGGMFGAVRLQMAIEEHGQGMQLVRFRLQPTCSLWALAIPPPLLLLSAKALIGGAWIGGAMLAITSILLLLRVLADCAGAMGAALMAIQVCAQVKAAVVSTVRRMTMEGV